MAELSTLASPKIFFIWNAGRSTFLLCQEAERNSREIPFASKNADLKVRCLLYSPHPHDPQGWASNLTTDFFAMIFLLLSSLLWWLLKQPRARKTSNCWDHSKRSSSIFCLTCEHFHALNLQERNLWKTSEIPSNQNQYYWNLPDPPPYQHPKVAGKKAPPNFQQLLTSQL